MRTGKLAAPSLEHKRVYDAIAAGKPAKARRESERLVKDALQLLNDALEEDC